MTRRGIRWAVRLGALAVAASVLSVWASGCEHRVVPPAASGVAGPTVRVLLVDYAGQHCSLVLPRKDGAAVEYSYGEWEWFAFGRANLWRAPLIMLLPSRGTLGKREFTGPHGMYDFAKVTTEPGWNIIPLDLPADRVKQLLAGLDGAYESLRASERYYQPYETYFVLQDNDYWMFHNCHHVTGAWLRELGCTLEATSVLDGWQVRDEPRAVRYESTPAPAPAPARASDARERADAAGEHHDG